MKLSTIKLPFIFFSALSVLMGCGQSLPDCSSEQVKTTLISIIKEKVVGNKIDDWYIEPKFEVVNTENKTSSKIQCKAQINFKIPDIYKNEKTSQLNISYDIQLNDMNKDQFSVTTQLVGIQSISALNDEGWNSYQDYLFKQANLEIFTSDYKDKFFENIKKMSAMGGSIFALSEISKVYAYSVVRQKLLDEGWKDDGVSSKNPNLFIFTKEKYILNVTFKGNILTGAVVDTDETHIYLTGKN